MLSVWQNPKMISLRALYIWTALITTPKTIRVIKYGYVG